MDSTRLGASPSESLVEWARVAILGLIPRRDHGDVTISTSRQRGSGGDADTVHVSVVGPPHVVGRVIGRGGATYQALRHVFHRVGYVNSLHTRFHVTPIGGVDYDLPETP